MTLQVGAYDHAGWAGLVLSDAPGRGFAVRLAVERDGERADGDDFFYLVHEVGPNAPDGSYARVSFDTSLPFGRADATPITEKPGRVPGLTLEWTRTDEGAVLRATTGFTGLLELRGYFPWDWRGTWRADRSALIGTSADGQIGLAVTSTPTCSPTIDASGEGVVRIDVQPGGTLVVELAFSSPARSTSPTRSPSPTSIDDLLTARASAYAASRPTVSGAWHGLIEAISNSLHWMVLLQPERHRRYTPAGRRWIFPREGGGRDHWTVFCWDALFNALELSVESPALAAETLDAVLETQYDDGNVPNWRGRFFGTRDRSQPPVGAFTALSVYLRHGDRSLLHRAFARLERWSAWWSAPKAEHLRRDGNGNGLFEWGSDLDVVGASPAPWERRAPPHQLAAWESGQDDLPNWDEAEWVDEHETLDLDAVDLNAYLALDLECLGRIADVLGLADRAGAYRTQYARLVARMNEHLWDDARGMYADRRWDGRFSPRLAASNFLPLVAGVPPRDRAERMLETLCDPGRFWGEWIVPTISRDDPAFDQQQYWRGTIWPPTNYLLYEGLRRYHFDDVAQQLAERSVAMFLDTWRRLQLCRENYDSRTGQGAGQRHQSWGALFALIGLQEFVHVTPWDGLRLGSPAAVGASTVRRLGVAGRDWTVALSPNGLRVEADGRALLATDRPAAFRHVTVDDRTLEATVTSQHALGVSIDRAREDARWQVDRDVVDAPGGALRLSAGTYHLSVEGLR